jgi:predicted Zn-dependent protease
MGRSGIPTLVAVLLLGCTVTVAQMIEDEDSFKQDYFSAVAGGEKQSLLWTVERGHFSQRVLDEFKKGYYDSVFADLRYVLNRFPNHPRALSLIGEVALIINDPKLALPHFEEAVEMYPQYALTNAQYGRYLCRIGDYTAGVLRLRRAIEQQADLAIAHAWLAEAYFASGQLPAGTEAARRARGLGFTRTIEGEPAQ